MPSTPKTASKKFIFLITHYHPHTFGAELFAQKLAQYLAKQNHQVHVVTGLWNPHWKHHQTIHGVQVHRIPTQKIRYLQTNYFIYPQYRYTISLINQVQPDFIHAHIYPSLVTGALLPTSAQKVVTLQGGDLADYSEVFTPFPFIFRPIIAASLRRYQKIHATSSYLQSRIKSLASLSAQVIPNGVESSLLTHQVNALKLHQKFNYPATKIKAISASRLTPKNNLSNLIHAIKLSRDSQIDIGLVIAGSGHQHSKLQHLIRQLNLQPYIKLLGHVPHRQTLDLVKASDLFLRVPHQEGFGIAPLEALALGTSTIANTTGGLADFISPQTAFVSPDTNAITISRCIHNFHTSSQSKIKTKIKTAQSLVKRKFTWDTLLKDFTQTIYQL